MKQLSIKINMLLNTCGSMIRLICNWLLTVAVVRFSHGFDAAGILSLSMAVCNMVQPFAEYRLRTIHVTDVTGERTTGEYFGLRFITTGIALAVGIVYAAATCSWSAVPVIVVYLVSQLISGYLEGFHAVDQREMRMDYIGISYALQGVFGLIGFCLVLALSNSLFSAVVYLAVCYLTVGIFWDYPKTRQFGTVRPTFNCPDIVSTLARLFPIVIATVCASGVITIPRQYLAVVAGSAALGIYSSVSSPTVVMQVGAQYVYTPLLGLFAERFHQNKQSALLLFRKVVVGILVVGLACLAAFTIFGEYALQFVFGSEIAEYSYLLIPALACTFITGFCLFTNDLLISVRDYRGSLLGNLFAAGISIVATVPVIDACGLNGVSYCGIIGYGCGAALMLAFLYFDYIRKS